MNRYRWPAKSHRAVENCKQAWDSRTSATFNLTDPQKIEAEDDYRICARRGSIEEAKPKKKRRKMTEVTESEEE